MSRRRGARQNFELQPVFPQPFQQGLLHSIIQDHRAPLPKNRTSHSACGTFGEISIHTTNRDTSVEFYRKLGYAIIGVVPDANGRGRPDIYMSKRL